MKKSAIATAIAAASLSTGAHAVISTSVTGFQLVTGGVDITLPCVNTYNPGFTSGLLLTGVTPGTAINLTGQVCLDPGTGIHVALNIALAGTGGIGGTTFNTGSISVFTDYGSGWMFAYNVDASTSTIGCPSLAWIGSSPTLPATCMATLLGNSATLYLW
jgi:hypothetical protein